MPIWCRHGASRLFLGGGGGARRFTYSAEGAAAGVWGRSPQRGARGRSPHVWGLGGRTPRKILQFLEANYLTRKCLN